MVYPKIKNYHKLKISLFLALFVFEFLFLVPYSFANTGNCTSGSVAWGEKVGFISFYGAGGVGDYGVTISSSALTGYAWGAQTGWIHMGNAIPYSYGVVNTIVSGTGQLSGYAWGEKVGFISFASSTPDYSETPAAGKYGVWIDGSGVFHGYAWGAQTGWIHFNHTSYTYGVTTTWLPDSTPPTVNVTNPPTGSYNSAGWTSLAPTFNCADSGSGCDTSSCKYSYTTSTYASMTSIGCTDAIPAPGEGTGLTLYVAAKDIATNTGTNSYTGFTYDTTPPTGTITLGAGATYWTTNTSPTIALTTNDAAQYQLCGNSASAGADCADVKRIWVSYTATPTAYDFSSQGVKTLYVQFKDTVGNISATYSNSITIDTIAPTAGTVTVPATDVYENTTSYTWIWGAGSDSGSGLHATTPYHLYTYTDSSCTLNESDQGTTASTSKTVSGLVNGNSYWAKIVYMDKAGNTSSSACSVHKVIVDTVAPETLTIDFPVASTSYNSTSWDAGGPFSWTCTDSESGCNISTCEVYTSTNTDLGPCYSGGVSYKPIEDGNYTIKIKEQDNAGNEATSSTVAFTYDTVAPSSVSSDVDGTWHTSAFNVTLNCTDATSGCDKIYYCTNVYGDPTCTPDTNYVTPGSTFNFATQGEYVLRLKGIDAAGNSTAPADETNHLKLDGTPPTNIGISSISASTTQLTVTASTAVDSGAGLDSTPYQFQETTGHSGATSSGWQTSTIYTDSGLTPNTQYAYGVRARDSLSNTSEYSSASLKYTLTDVPGMPTLTVDSANQITATLTTDSNPAGTQYYIENITNTTNSGWITDNSWASSGLTCNTEYVFTVKAKNGDGVETSTLTASATTSACASQATTPSGGGGGLPAGAYSPPGPPLAFSINNGNRSTATRDVVLNFTAGPNVARMSVSNDPNFINATQESYSPTKLWTLTDGQGQKNVYVKFFTNYGVVSNIISASINYSLSSTEPSGITDAVNKISEQAVAIGKQIAGLFGNQNTFIPQINYPSIAESVPAEPQIVFQGGNIITQKQFEKIDVLPLPQPIKDLAFKFPKFASTLEKVGISKPSDAEKLKIAQLSFPSLSEVAGVPASLAFSKFTDEQKQKIPSNITFAKTGADNIDFNIKVSVSDLSRPVQSITTIQGKPLYLTVKPDNPAETVKGYVIFKSANSKSAFLDWTSKLSAALSASLLDATNITKNPNTSKNLPEVTVQKDIVLSQFDYTDSGGIWTAQVQAPNVDGKYEIRTVIQYKEKTTENKLSENLSMILVVDPEGYIYEKTTDNKETRIENAKVSIYWLNPDTKKYELWPAKDFQQTNPQITDITGKYSFLVPPGTYQLKIESPDYVAYQGQSFEVQEGSGIHQNIELKLKNWWGKFFTVERILMGIMIIMLVLVFVSIIIVFSYFARRDKLNTIKVK